MSLDTPDPSEAEARAFVPAVIVFYGGMIGLAVLWMWLRDEPMHRLLAPGEPAELWLQIAVGIGVGVGTVVVSRLMERWFEFARRLSREIRQLLPPVGPGAVAVAAVFSSIGEEVFFRGAMQDHLGLWVTAILFGVVHGFMDRRYLSWMVFAGIMGLAFGLMTAALGTLLAPILAHFTVNYLNLGHLVNTTSEPR